MARPKVLIAAPHHWTSPFQVAGHHLARAFVDEGWDVAYVSNPISPLHLARGWTRDLSERWTIYRRGGVQPDDSMWAYVPGAPVTPSLGPVLGSRTVLRAWARLSMPNVVSKLRGRGFGAVDLLYVDTVVQGFWLKAIEHGRSVLRVGDRMTAFDRFSPAMAMYQGELARDVDLVAYSARNLAPDIERFGARRAIHLPNGVDVSHFSREPAPSSPFEFTNVPRPIAIYVGAMDDWFDFDLVNTLAASMPDVSFVLVGPSELARRRLADRSNLYLIGPRPYAQLPAFLRHSDVGLIPFDKNRYPALVNGIHPLKLYEYLASELPVVATRWDEIASLGSPAVLADTPDEFGRAIRSALNGTFDRDAAQSFVAPADWRLRVRALVEA